MPHAINNIMKIIYDICCPAPHTHRNHIYVHLYTVHLSSLTLLKLTKSLYTVLCFLVCNPFHSLLVIMVKVFHSNKYN